MKKKFQALKDKLRAINPLTEKTKAGEVVGQLPRNFNPNGKRKGFYVKNPNVTPTQLQEIERLVEEWKPHLVVEHQSTPRQDPKTGKWFDPMLSIGQPFDKPTEDDLYDYGEDL